MLTKTRQRIEVQWMIRADLREVLEIERESFPEPWSEEIFFAQLHHRNAISMVAKSGEQVIGYFVYELFPRRIEIENFAVSPWCRRLGVGRIMLDRLKGKLAHRRNRITLYVRESNLDAQLFFRAMLFEAVGIEDGAYDVSDETAYRMCYRVKPDAKPEPK